MAYIYDVGNIEKQKVQEIALAIGNLGHQCRELLCPFISDNYPELQTIDGLSATIENKSQALVGLIQVDGDPKPLLFQLFRRIDFTSRILSTEIFPAMSDSANSGMPAASFSELSNTLALQKSLVQQLDDYFNRAYCSMLTPKTANEKKDEKLMPELDAQLNYSTSINFGAELEAVMAKKDSQISGLRHLTIHACTKAHQIQNVVSFALRDESMQKEIKIANDQSGKMENILRKINKTLYALENPNKASMANKNQKQIMKQRQGMLGQCVKDVETLSGLIASVEEVKDLHSAEMEATLVMLRDYAVSFGPALKKVEIPAC